jgi:hypothetical protein
LTALFSNQGKAVGMAKTSSSKVVPSTYEAEAALLLDAARSQGAQTEALCRWICKALAQAGVHNYFWDRVRGAERLGFRTDNGGFFTIKVSRDDDE